MAFRYSAPQQASVRRTIADGLDARYRQNCFPGVTAQFRVMPRPNVRRPEGVFGMTIAANEEASLTKSFLGASRTRFFDHDCRSTLHADARRYGRGGHQGRVFGRRNDANPSAG